jgi:2-polyprenyl-6-methoxyphenol hydroxylase-like FAD-dependent oxidoreductase
LSRSRRALISGAGIAGPAAAYWLSQAGWRVTLVDNAPALRSGGYMIDFWGPGLEVAERMGLGAQLRARGYRFGELRFVGRDGRQLARLRGESVAGALGERYVSILRADLSAMLFARAADRVETRFDDEATALWDAGEQAEVSFRRGGRERFDLVVGADGLHSNIRRLAFPESRGWLRPLGYLAAAITVEDYPHVDPLAYVSRTVPGRQVARYALRDGRTTLFFIFAAELAKGRRLDDLAGQKALLTDLYRDVGWEAREVLAAIDRAQEVYMDAVGQVFAPAWSRGPYVLVGDAAYCLSLLAGEGASFALAGAYVLAGELARAGGRVREAAAAYEAMLRPVVTRKQRSARRLGGWFAPRTRPGLVLRNQLTRLMSAPALSRLIAGPMLDDGFALPDYPLA